jgi:SagB-type dehydrogenase family enzyme
MPDDTWTRLRLSIEEEDSLWEIFHENTKTSRFDSHPSAEQVVATMSEMYQSLPYDGLPSIPLPRDLAPMRRPLLDALLTRATARDMRPGPVSLPELATVLHCAYGITRGNEGTAFPRPFRAVPSGGALYPLEIYLWARRVEDIEAGLYRYDPVMNSLTVLRTGDLAREVADTLIYPDVARDSSVVFYITAVFPRTMFKYGDRGYRFVLLEAGHVAQNLNLAAHGLGFGTINVGGFFDRRADELLSIDGVAHSTVYVAGLGHVGGAAPPNGSLQA